MGYTSAYLRMGKPMNTVATNTQSGLALTKQQKSTHRLSLYALAVILALAHLTLGHIFPGRMLNYIAILIVAGAIFLYAQTLSESFYVMMLLYTLSCFRFAQNQGGLFNIAFFFVFLLLPGFMPKALRPNGIVSLLLIIFVGSNFLGWLFRSPADIESKIVAFMTLSTILIAFTALSNSQIKLSHMRYFMNLSFGMLIYIFLTQINTRFGILTFPSPVIGFSEAYHQKGSAFSSIVGTPPLTGEFGLLNFCFCLGLALRYNSVRSLGISHSRLLMMATLSLIVLLITDSRSTFLLAAFFILFSTIQNLTIRGRESVSILSSLGVLIVLIIASSFIFDYSTLLRRFDVYEGEDITMEGIRTGEDINRDTAFALGNSMLKREDWTIGHGWNNYSNNRVAWFGTTEQRRGDPHSLFYSLPMLFGWFGSAAFLLLIAYTILAKVKVGRNDNNNIELSRALSSSLSLAITMLMINQYKQSFITAPNYFTLIMIWLGFALTIKHNGIQHG